MCFKAPRPTVAKCGLLTNSATGVSSAIRKLPFIHLTSAESARNSLRHLPVAWATNNPVFSVRSLSENLPKSLKWPDWKMLTAHHNRPRANSTKCQIGRSGLKSLSKSWMMVSPSGSSQPHCTFQWNASWFIVRNLSYPYLTYTKQVVHEFCEKG